jgi:Ca-activated chloride channel family protein
VTFAHPALLLVALAGVAILAWLYQRATARRTAQALAYSNVAFALDAIKPSRLPAMLLFGGWLLGSALLGAAVAGPHFTARLPIKDGTVMLCIDTSGSMSATDIDPTRELAAKAAARTFINAVPDGTNVGIVSFSSGASVVQAPTPDRDEALAAVNRIPPPNGATAIGDALTLAAEQFPEHGHRVIVLLTDGVNNRGVDPVSASQDIGAKGVKIYTVGIGTSGSGMLIPGTLEPAEIDEDALRAIAQNGGGRYIAASDAQALSSAFADLARDTVWETKRVDGSFPFAFAGGALVALTLLAGIATGRLP